MGHALVYEAHSMPALGLPGLAPSAARCPSMPLSRARKDLALLIQHKCMCTHV